MKILLVTRRSVFKKDCRKYFKAEYGGIKTDLRLAGMFGWYWHKALTELNHEIRSFVFYQGPFLDSFREWNIFIDRVQGRFPITKNIPVYAMNKSLIKAAVNYKPEFMLVDAGELIYPQTFKEIKERTKTKIVNWLLDDPIAQGWKNVVESLPLYDLLFVFDPAYINKFRKMGITSTIDYLPCACDPDVHKTFPLSAEEKSNFSCQLCFVGNITDQRAEMFKELTDFDLGIWSWNPWRLRADPVLAKCYRGVTWGEEMSRVFTAGSIVLNNHHRQTIDGVNMKTFEIAGSGAFQLVDKRKELDNLFQAGREIICYKDVLELKELIEYYLRRPQECREIAQKARERAYREHTYKHRLSRLISQTEKLL